MRMRLLLPLILSFGFPLAALAGVAKGAISPSDCVVYPSPSIGAKGTPVGAGTIFSYGGYLSSDWSFTKRENGRIRVWYFENNKSGVGTLVWVPEKDVVSFDRECESCTPWEVEGWHHRWKDEFVVLAKDALAKHTGGYRERQRVVVDELLKVEHDDFSGLYWVTVKFGEQAPFGDRLISGKWLDAKLVVSPGDPASYDLVLWLMQKRWMFIPSGTSLELKIDGSIFPIYGDGSARSRSVIGPEQISEHASYRLSFDVIQRIANAKEPVQFRVTGESDFYTGTFTPKFIPAMKKVADLLAPKGWSINPDGRIQLRE